MSEPLLRISRYKVLATEEAVEIRPETGHVATRHPSGGPEVELVERGISLRRAFRIAKAIAGWRREVQA